MSGARVSLHLVNGPYILVAGERHAIPQGSKRLLVLMAIRRCLSRRATATLLWPGVEPRRAAGNLRSASWRLRCAGINVLVDRDGILSIDPEVDIDTELLCRRAKRLTVGHGTPADLDMLPATVQALDLLPGWYEDWVSDERERLHALMLTTIDAISVQFRRAGRFAEAIDAALVAVTVDPLRVSSRTALIDAHLAEGNVGEARRAEASYRLLLGGEFPVVPQPRRPQRARTHPSDSAATCGQARRATGNVLNRPFSTPSRSATNPVS